MAQLRDLADAGAWARTPRSPAFRVVVMDDEDGDWRVAVPA